MLCLALAGAAVQAMPPAEPALRAHSSRARFGEIHVVARADIPRALREGEAARRAARRVFGIQAPPFAIVDQRLASRSPAGTAAPYTYYWPFRDTPAAAPGILSTDTLLRHEIGHDLFIRFLVPSTRGNQYGGDAPDWLDEMAAVAFEDEDEGRRRRADVRLRAERGALIPLARFTAMPHPEWSAGTSASAPLAGAAVIQPRSAETGSYYATVRALLDLLIDRLGDGRAITLLAAEARAGRPLERWLVDHVARDRTAGLAGLDSEISAFIRSNPRYTKGRKGVNGG